MLSSSVYPGNAKNSIEMLNNEESTNTAEVGADGGTENVVDCARQIWYRDIISRKLRNCDIENSCIMVNGDSL